MRVPKAETTLAKPWDVISTAFALSINNGSQKSSNFLRIDTNP